MKVYIGNDWSEAKHDMTLLNEQGQLLYLAGFGVLTALTSRRRLAIFGGLRNLESW